MSYTHIIIGAGSAGAVLAYRLSENPAHKILVLEAGGKDSAPFIHIPAAFFKLFGSKYDWNYYAQPEQGTANRGIFMPRGKVMGGSSSINAMIYIRGHAEDYNEWAQEGNPGWSYQEVLPYFIKAEKNAQLHNEFHGTNGPLHVTNPKHPNMLSKVFVQAAVEHGFKELSDLNTPDNQGAGLFQLTQHNGKRWSTADAYLKPAMQRKNVQVVLHAQVTEILFDGATATGVKYQMGWNEKTATCSGEVIVCAGAINSPQLLMQNGIGPADTLKKLNIPVKVNLPVGQYLQDHPVVPLIWNCTQKITLDTEETPLNFLKYFIFQKGPMTSNLAEAGGFFKSNPELNAPDLQWHFGPCFFVDHGRVRPKGNGYSAAPILVKPKSRGYITLNPTDISGSPHIHQQFFSNPDDLQALISGYRITEKMMLGKAFEPYRGSRFSPSKTLQSDDEIATYIHQHVEALYHPVGTCRMGNNANNSVVNHELKVHGFKNLRVVDASIMPSVVRGNTNAPTIMIAEKAADFILHKP